MVSAAQALFLFGRAALANRSIALTAWRIKPMTQKASRANTGGLGLMIVIASDQCFCL